MKKLYIIIAILSLQVLGTSCSVFQKSSGSTTSSSSASASTISFPSSISPDGLAKDKEFKASAGSEIVSMNCKIYDSNGKLIAELKSVKDVWTGGNAPSGNYAYDCEYSLKSGKKLSKKGAVQLIKQ